MSKTKTITKALSIGSLLTALALISGTAQAAKGEVFRGSCAIDGSKYHVQLVQSGIKRSRVTVIGNPTKATRNLGVTVSVSGFPNYTYGTGIGRTGGKLKTIGRISIGQALPNRSVMVQFGRLDGFCRVVLAARR